MGIALTLVSLALLACLAMIGFFVWERPKLTTRAAIAERDAETHQSRAAEISQTLEGANTKLADAHQRIAASQEELASLRAKVEASEAQARRDREAFRAQLEEHLSSVTGKALSDNNQRFLQLATESFEKHQQKSTAEIDKRREAIDRLVEPITETLKKTDAKLAEIEKARLAAFSALDEKMAALGDSGRALREETQRLVGALSKPHVRGAWGEITLRRVVEIAGLKSYLDFAEQTSTSSDEGRRLRPDLIVNLPNDRQIVVDAKTNTEPYMQAIHAADAAEQSALLDRFAEGVLTQAKQLSSKGYWSMYDGTPDFVVMFIPGDQFLDAALERKPRLIELAADHNIILASPSSLIGLLRAVQVGWRERDLTEQARELFELGRELHERASIVFGHINDVGSRLGQAVNSYNKLTSSAQSRLIPTLRKFEGADAKSSKQLTEPKPIASLPGTLEHDAGKPADSDA